MNTVILTGNLTRDPEVRYSTGANQMAICKFSIAVNDGYGDKKQTSYLPITVFGKAAESCEKYLSKGSKVCIKGRLQTGSYEKDGVKHYTTDIIAENYGGVEFLSSGQQGESKASQSEQQVSDPEQMGFTALDSDDIPF